MTSALQIVPADRIRQPSSYVIASPSRKATEAQRLPITRQQLTKLHKRELAESTYLTYSNMNIYYPWLMLPYLRPQVASTDPHYYCYRVAFPLWDCFTGLTSNLPSATGDMTTTVQFPP